MLIFSVSRELRRANKDDQKPCGGNMAARRIRTAVPSRPIPAASKERTAGEKGAYALGLGMLVAAGCALLAVFILAAVMLIMIAAVIPVTGGTLWFFNTAAPKRPPVLEHREDPRAIGYDELSGRR